MISGPGPSRFRLLYIIVAVLFLAGCDREGLASLVAAFSTESSAVKEEARLPLTSLNEKADRIVVFKEDRLLFLYQGDRFLRMYGIALGREPEGPKRCQGDKRTPEGTYTISGRNPNSAYHRSLRISYPNAQDRALAAELGCKPGGDIMIHGLPPKWAWIGDRHTMSDWTLGCIAVTDEEIEEIWDAVPDGTTVDIRP